jgi:signal transduction histidine kinase/ActR/RegA family two-component response regulator
MKKVFLRSMRVSQMGFLVSVVILAFLTILNSYFNAVSRTAEERYKRLLKLENTFGDVISLENEVLSGLTHYATLLTVSQDVLVESSFESKYFKPILLKEREYIFSKLLQTSEENLKHYRGVRETLPELIAGVRSLHKHHIVILKENSIRGETIRWNGAGAAFQRSPVQSATELDIIDSAVDVQSRLLDVVSIFYEMELGNSPDDIEENFQSRMTAFNTLVNRFGDYSLDAQDGLVVEDLLLTGKQFTEAFRDLLLNNRKIDMLKLQMHENQSAVSEMFAAGMTELNAENEELKWLMNAAQYSSTAVSFVLILWLLYYGLTLSRAFAKTMSEAKRIQADLKYRIPQQSRGYHEFNIIYDTLNTLAETAESQLRSLKKMQGELSRRVQERTAELVHMNTRLKNEISDKLKADESRRELETRLIRAKKMEAIGTLAGGVAHDLNNILSGVVSYPELILLDMKKSDPLYPTILAIRQSGEKAASIVQDLLTLARRGVTVSEIVNFKQLLEEYLQSPEYLALGRLHEGVTVHCEMKEEDLKVKGSRLHLMKTVMNLVVNGMEAMPDGGTLTLSTDTVYIDTVFKGYDTVKEGDYVCFSITDTGIGMTLEVTEQIFEPFFTQKNMGRSGTGLGMAVVYSTVKDHGGYIDVKSIPGKGSTITVYFPMCRESMAPATARPELSSIVGNNQHILVVDDIYEQRQIASSMLKRLNYTVATAAGGDEAVAYIKNNSVDLVVLDMIMPPGMDGLDTFMALQAVMPDVKVVIASGFSENDRVMRAQELGAGRYIRKPYSLEILGIALRDALNLESSRLT